MNKQIISAIVAGAAALTLTACGDNTGTVPAVPPTTAAPQPPIGVSAQHNGADITFAQNMIVHHSQAIDMAEMADGQAASPQVKDLAGKIAQAQEPEIGQMKNMLKAWSAPESNGMYHSGGSMPGMSMPGMMSEQQMGQMEQAQGAAFDRMFLQMMIEHHKGAIQMGQTEVGQGQNPQAKELAQKIISDQRQEISTMENLLKTV